MKFNSIGNTLEEVWLDILQETDNNGLISYPKNKEIKEKLAYTLVIENPRKRYILNPIKKMDPFYMIGELLWYLKGDNSVDFISYYDKMWNDLSEDNKTLNSAYGYRIFSGKHPLIPFNQWDNIKKQLSEDNDTRQAIIHLHTPNDKKVKDEVCSLCLQFFIRDNKLYMHTTMRSNSIMWGTIYDIYTFTMLQELLANELNVELGEYYHTAGSIHIYSNEYEIVNNILNINNYNKEYLTIHMPKEFKDEIPTILEYEEKIRLYGFQHINNILNLSRFSRNILYLLNLYSLKINHPNDFNIYYNDIWQDLFDIYAKMIFNIK